MSRCKFNLRQALFATLCGATVVGAVEQVEAKHPKLPKDCICHPAHATYGYHPVRWRRWPEVYGHPVPEPAMYEFIEPAVPTETLPPLNGRPLPAPPETRPHVEPTLPDVPEDFQNLPFAPEDSDPLEMPPESSKRAPSDRTVRIEYTPGPNPLLPPAPQRQVDVVRSPIVRNEFATDSANKVAPAAVEPVGKIPLGGVQPAGGARPATTSRLEPASFNSPTNDQTSRSGVSRSTYQQPLPQRQNIMRLPSTVSGTESDVRPAYAGDGRDNPLRR